MHRRHADPQQLAESGGNDLVRLAFTRAHSHERQGGLHRRWFTQPSGGHAVDIPVHTTARRIRGLTSDAGALEEHRVRVGRVSRHVQDHHRVASRGAVEVEARQLPVLAQERVVESPRAHRFAVGCARGALPDCRDDVVDVRARCRAHMHVREELPPQHRVHVGLDEARDDGRAVEVDALGHRAGEREDVVATDGDDPAVDGRQCGDRAGRGCHPRCG